MFSTNTIELHAIISGKLFTFISQKKTKKLSNINEVIFQELSTAEVFRYMTTDNCMKKQNKVGPKCATFNEIVLGGSNFVIDSMFDSSDEKRLTFLGYSAHKIRVFRL